jgi:hypothetical protein
MAGQQQRAEVVRPEDFCPSLLFDFSALQDLDVFVAPAIFQG